MTRWTRPLEFQVLRIELEPWTPIDSLSVGKLMAWRLAENRQGELVRGMLARRIGAGDANRLMGDLPSWAPTIIGTGTRAPEAAPSGAASAPAADPPGAMASAGTALPPGLEWLAATARPGGSNSWVVAGSRTATGRPLLANDPHLGLEMPSIWYEMHLVAAGLDVAGATIPGGPFVIIGHNQSIAWGLTNTGADVQDFYAEDVDFARKRYLYQGAWQPLSTERVEITVRGRSEPDVYEILRTRHGAIVATEAAWEDPPVFTGREPRAYPRPLALRWESIGQGEGASAFEEHQPRAVVGRVPRRGAPLRRAVAELHLRRHRRQHRLRDVGHPAGPRAGRRIRAGARLARHARMDRTGPDRPPPGDAQSAERACSSPPTPRSTADGPAR